MTHADHVDRFGEPRAIRKMAPRGDGSIKDGYRLMYRPGHPNAQKSNGLVFEHRLVMSDCLGRPVLDAEEVHHKNGNTLDNRLTKGHEYGGCPQSCCNLELWDRSQPPGQRVADKIHFYIEFLSQHGYVVTRAGP